MLRSPMTVEQILALPAVVDLPTAGACFGHGRNKSYELARTDEFPCDVLPVGNAKYRVARSAILDALGIEDTLTRHADSRNDRPAA